MTGKVYQENALDLLQATPSEGIAVVLTDAMYGVHSLYSVYDWGHDPAGRWPRKSERAEKHWEYHEPIYRECLRVLKPGGVLAWGAGHQILGGISQVVWWPPNLVTRSVRRDSSSEWPYLDRANARARADQISK